MRKQFQISENGFEISKITLDLQIDNWNLKKKINLKYRSFGE